MPNWLLEWRRAIAAWLMPEDSPAQRRLFAKRKLYRALVGLPRGEALELMAETIAESVAPLANQGAIQPRIAEVVQLSVGLETSDFVYLLSDATRQYLQQRILVMS